VGNLFTLIHLQQRQKACPNAESAIMTHANAILTLSTNPSSTLRRPAAYRRRAAGAPPKTPKATFGNAKGYLSSCKRRPFNAQKTAFYKALVIRILRDTLEPCLQNAA
jgi:hypothetical protein